MYLPALTDDEILSYAESYAETALERELTRRFTAFREEARDKDAEIERLKCDAASLQDELDRIKGES